MLIRTMEPDFVFQNHCGQLTQLVRDGWKQVNVITSVAGCTRGGHYHKFNHEAFYVVQGSFLLEVCKDGVRESYEFSAGDMFEIPPYVAHTFTYRAETILVGMYDRGVELSETEKDIWVAES